MNQHWKAFLESQSARIGDDGEARFDAAPADADCALCDLSHLGLIALGGEDRAQFLQGQLTNDIRLVDASHSQLSGFCGPKGRMLANFRVFERAQRIYLQLPASNLEPVLRRLRMFVLRAKVELEDASDQLVRMGMAGDCAPRLLGGRFPGLPEAVGAVSSQGEITLIRLPDAGSARFELLGPPAEMQILWKELAVHATAVNADFWALLDVRAGIPTVYPETVEAFVPQMANMQLVDGVSFTKGCYTGQEIVARMQYLGKLKRRMYLAHVDTAEAPKAGDPLFAPQNASGQGAGRVVDARPVPEGGYDLLAVAEIESAENGELRLHDDQGPLLKLRELPYSLDSDPTAN
jgi:folate-binding protein YgfZ